MPTPLSPSSSQEIIPISPPSSCTRTTVKGKGRSGETSSNRNTTRWTAAIASSSSASSSSKVRLPPIPVIDDGDDEGDGEGDENKRPADAIYDNKGKRKAGAGVVSVDESIKRKSTKSTKDARLSRSRVTEQMISTLGKGSNPITNSDLYSRTDHFISCATGHQQSNRGGGSAGATPYWQVRTSKMIEQSREKRTSILAGCLFYINGSTGPKLSNLQLQHLITTNGGRFSPVQSSACTHIIANGGLSGSKAQKWINGQGGRGAARRSKVVRVEWVLDSVDRGAKLSEAGYGVIEDPSQPSLFKTLGVTPKLESDKGA